MLCYLEEMVWYHLNQPDCNDKPDSHMLGNQGCYRCQQSNLEIATFKCKP